MAITAHPIAQAGDVIQPDPSTPGGYINTKTGQKYPPGSIAPVDIPGVGKYYAVNPTASGNDHTGIDPATGESKDMGTWGTFWKDAGLGAAATFGGIEALGGVGGGVGAAGGAGASGADASALDLGNMGMTAGSQAMGAGTGASAAAAAATTGSSALDKFLGIGSMVGKFAQGAAEGTQAAAGLGIQSDRLDLDRFKALQDQYQQAWRNAMRGGFAQGAKDVQIGNLPPGVQMGTITGGMRPSAVIGAPQAGADFQRQALLQLMGGPPVLPARGTTKVV